MNNPETPTGVNGKTENYKVSYIDIDFDEEWDFEVCGFGFDMEMDGIKQINENRDVSVVEFFHDQKSDEHFGLHTPEKQKEIMREAIRLGKVKLELVSADKEKVVKSIDKEEIKEGKEIKTGNKTAKNARAYDRERQNAKQQSENRTRVANAKIEKEKSADRGNEERE